MHNNPRATSRTMGAPVEASAAGAVLGSPVESVPPSVEEPDWVAAASVVDVVVPGVVDVVVVDVDVLDVDDVDDVDELDVVVDPGDPGTSVQVNPPGSGVLAVKVIWVFQ